MSAGDAKGPAEHPAASQDTRPRRSAVEILDFLHDELLPMLAAAIQDLEEAHVDDPLVDAVKEKLAVCWQLARGKLMNADPGAESQSAASALRAAAALALGRCPVTVMVHAPEQTRVDHQQVLVVCAGELLRNVAAHADASRCDVYLLVRDSFVSLTVTDDGCGTDDESLHGLDHSHYGTRGIRRRVEAIGGKATWRRREVGGTQATVVLRREGYEFH